MRAPVIRVVDTGVGGEFERSVAVTTNLIHAMSDRYEFDDESGGGYTSLRAHIETVSASSRPVFEAALTTPSLVVHIASHVDDGESDEPSFTRYLDGVEHFISAADVGADLQREHRGFAGTCLIVDGCNSARKRFTSEVRGWLEDDVAYVGTTREVTDGDSAVFSAAFYGRLLNKKGAGVTPWDRVWEAAQLAVDVHTQIIGKASPFKLLHLTPNRQARRSFTD